MERVNRTLLTNPKIFAFFAMLLMQATLLESAVRGQVATAHGVAESPKILQVAGSQARSEASGGGEKRPGLLQVLAGGAKKGSADHRHQNMGNSNSKGLLNTLFSKTDDDKGAKTPKRAQPNARTTRSQGSNRSNQTVAASPQGDSASKGQPDWTGVPYHDAAKPTTNSRPTPLRDPGVARPIEDVANTAIARRGNSENLNPLPAPRRAPAPKPVSSMPQRRQSSQSPAEVAIANSDFDKLSTSTSSRRSRRQKVGPMQQPSLSQR